MNQIILPALWLIVLLAGLPQLSETVYSPALPDIARALSTSESMVEYTLTIYLFSFAIGTLFWGKVSDKYGRKPCILVGLFIFVLGCIGCYLSDSITSLMISRFVQAFGGSIGSVLGQSVCRDAFHGPALGKVYASIGIALAVFPAIGPIIGGVIAEQAGWPSIFLFLTFFGIVLFGLVAFRLPETHHADARIPVSLRHVAWRMLRDKKVLCLAFIVGASNGITFSYFAEGSFYLIEYLGLSPTFYGCTFFVMASSTILGGLLSKKLQGKHSQITIMSYGVSVILASCAFSSSLVLWHTYVHAFSTNTIIAITLLAQTGIMFGSCMACTNALSFALTEYKAYVGTASSLYGFMYYCLVSIFTLGMGYLHNDTLLVMPLYFLALSLSMLVTTKILGEPKHISL